MQASPVNVLVYCPERRIHGDRTASRYCVHWLLLSGLKKTEVFGLRNLLMEPVYVKVKQSQVTVVQAAFREREVRMKLLKLLDG